jgi:hypothetical protein
VAVDLNATLQNARQALARRQYERAVELVRGILASNPLFADAHFLPQMIRLHSGSSDPVVMKGIGSSRSFARA